MTQAKGQSCLPAHYYVMLSKHVDCDFSKVLAMWFYLPKYFLILEPCVCLQLLGVWCLSELSSSPVKMSSGGCGPAAGWTDPGTVWALPLITRVEPLTLSLSSLLCNIRVTITSTRHSADSQEQVGGIVTGSRKPLIKANCVKMEVELVA